MKNGDKSSVVEVERVGISLGCADYVVITFSSSFSAGEEGEAFTENWS